MSYTLTLSTVSSRHLEVARRTCGSNFRPNSNMCSMIHCHELLSRNGSPNGAKMQNPSKSQSSLHWTCWLLSSEVSPQGVTPDEAIQAALSACELDGTEDWWIFRARQGVVALLSPGLDGRSSQAAVGMPLAELLRLDDHRPFQLCTAAGLHLSSSGMAGMGGADLPLPRSCAIQGDNEGCKVVGSCNWQSEVRWKMVLAGTYIG